MMSKNVLILGSNGRFGHHAATAFSLAGWQVTRFDRSRDDLERAMAGADVVVMGWNPPGYHLWARQLAPMHRDVATAAKRVGATVILPGNVYVYGPDAPSPWQPDTPHRAKNPLGRLRIETEQIYRDHGTRTIVLRCGDFIDGRVTGNWFESYITKSVPKGFIRYPGDPGAPHAWAYLPDAARAAVQLAELRENLSTFEDVPFPGYTLSGEALASAISEATGQVISVKPFHWRLMWLMRPFMPMLRGVFEMRYLWSLPHELDGARFGDLVPGFEPTPVRDALRRVLPGGASGAESLVQGSEMSTQTR